MRCAAQQEQLAKGIRILVLQHVLSRLGQAKQLHLFGFELHALGRLEGQGANGARADVGQSREDADSPWIHPLLSEHAVHEQHAPAVRQAVGNEPGQAMEVGRESTEGLCSQGQMKGRQLELLPERLG